MSMTLQPPVTHPVTNAVDTLTSTLDDLLGGQLWTMPEPDLLAARVALETQAARLTAARWALTREIDGRGAAVTAGAASTTGWLVNRLRQAPGEAARELRLSAQVHPDGLPAAHAALAAGTITAAAATVIADTDRALSRYATVAQRAEAEQTLAEFATALTLPQLRAAALRVQLLLDPDQGDQLSADEAEQHAARSLRLGRNPDGTLRLTGQLDREAAAALSAALGPLAKPQPATTDSTGAPVRDPRSPAQRNADALMDLVALAMAHDQLPDRAGQPAQVVVTIDLDDLRAQHPGDPSDRPANTPRPGGAGTLDLGIPLSVAAVRRLACDAQLIPVVLGAHGQVLDLGRSTRIVSTPLRRALAVRDRGCSFPGCDRPVGWTQAHHITHWATGGPTDLDNLVLLCGHHHRAVHHDGWTVHLDPTDRLPTFTPPAWLDPDRRPRRNTRLRH